MTAVKIEPAVDPFSTVFAAGYNAFEAGQPWESCPYPISEVAGGRGRIDWLGGWYAARTEQALAPFIKRFGPIT